MKTRYRQKNRPATFWDKVCEWFGSGGREWPDKVFWMEEVSPSDSNYDIAPYELGSVFYESRFTIEVPR